ncbi:MAG: hypothetical protein QM831_05855 [Kofleriaceae bacterium]
MSMSMNVMTTIVKMNAAYSTNSNTRRLIDNKKPGGPSVNHHAAANSIAIAPSITR